MPRIFEQTRGLGPCRPGRAATGAFLRWALALTLGSCTPQGDPAIGPDGFRDDFERSDLGSVWSTTGAPWAIRDGRLSVRGARNRPLWLRRTLPRDVRIEFDAASTSPEGDIKVEIFGDGVSRAEANHYVATSYVIIFGGWNNSLNVLARLDEHGADRIVGPAMRVEPGRSYHFRIERQGSVLTVAIDGKQVMRLDDPSPLEGRGHDHFAFNNWETPLTFDNLRIEAL